MSRVMRLIAPVEVPGCLQQEVASTPVRLTYVPSVRQATTSTVTSTIRRPAHTGSTRRPTVICVGTRPSSFWRRPTKICSRRRMIRTPWSGTGRRCPVLNRSPRSVYRPDLKRVIMSSSLHDAADLSQASWCARLLLSCCYNLVYLLKKVGPAEFSALSIAEIYIHIRSR